MNITKTLLKLILGKGTFKSFSQFGEDAVLHAVFRYRKTGVYVDVGAYHPHLYSNTYALYRKGWSGLAIEPNPKMKPLWALFRPRDTFIQAGIGNGIAAYITHQDGAYNSFEAGFGFQLKELGELLHSNSITHIDFLNIDVEGMDLQVLETHDWSIRPQIIAVEAKAESPTREFLESKGYVLCGMTGLTLLFKDTEL